MGDARPELLGYMGYMAYMGDASGQPTRTRPGAVALVLCMGSK